MFDDAAGDGFHSHSDIIDAVGTTRLAEALGVKRPMVDGWKTRNSIPGPWFLRVSQAAAELGCAGVSVCRLARMAEEAVDLRADDFLPQTGAAR